MAAPIRQQNTIYLNSRIQNSLLEWSPGNAFRLIQSIFSLSRLKMLLWEKLHLQRLPNCPYYKSKILSWPQQTCLAGRTNCPERELGDLRHSKQRGQGPVTVSCRSLPTTRPESGPFCAAQRAGMICRTMIPPSERQSKLQETIIKCPQYHPAPLRPAIVAGFGGQWCLRLGPSHVCSV